MLRNTMGAWETCWELDKNTSRKKKLKKKFNIFPPSPKEKIKIEPLWVHASSPHWLSKNFYA
jgi:hypothetical protein